MPPARLNATDWRHIVCGPALVACMATGGSPPVIPAARSVGECDAPKPEWLWCDDFETDRLAGYFEYGRAEGRFVRSAGVGRDGSFGMRATYVPMSSEAGSLKLAIGKTPAPYFRAADKSGVVHREVFWRWYIMHPASWKGGGPDKMTRAVGFANAQWAQTTFAHVWDGKPGDDRLYLDPASGTDAAGALVTTAYNDFAHMRWLGSAPSRTNIFDASHLGKWVCVEAHARLNDAGQANGVFELWIDSAAEARRDGLNWLGAYSAFGINAVFFENYWNDKSPIEQSRYWDNIVVSTQRIGC